MKDSGQLEQRLLDEIMDIAVIDVHSHVPHSQPCARSLRELLGYHYFTELAHSAGMDREVLSEENPDEEMLPKLVEALEPLENTVQYHWMMELARDLFGFEDRKLTAQNWQQLARAIAEAGKKDDRPAEVLRESSIEKVFLTNFIDDDLDSINTDLFVPSLRADNLVFGFTEPEIRESLSEFVDEEFADAQGLRDGLENVTEHFADHGAVSLVISLPPNFKVFPVVESDLDTAVEKAVGGKPLSKSETSILQAGILFTLAELCQHYELPMQVMSGVVRNAYRHGVPQGEDLPVAGATLRSLLPLFNNFPEVTFCLSVLSDSQAQELASYGWILQNVVVSGHWWYDTVPAYIEQDLTARLQSVPRNKLIGYYSDMYKLEFGLPKYNMYRRVLARVLAQDLVKGGRGTEEEALKTARLLLRENPRRIFSL